MIEPKKTVATSDWFLVRTEGMGYWDYYRGL